MTACRAYFRRFRVSFFKAIRLARSKSCVSLSSSVALNTPSIPAPAASVSTRSSVGRPLDSRISTARSAVMVLVGSSTMSATRKTSHPGMANDSASTARALTASGARQRKKAMAPGVPPPSRCETASASTCP